MADGRGKQVSHIDIFVWPTASIGGTLRKSGRAGFVEMRRSGRRPSMHMPAEQALALPVAKIRAAIRVLRRAETIAVEKGLLDRDDVGGARMIVVEPTPENRARIRANAHLLAVHAWAAWVAVRDHDCTYVSAPAAVEALGSLVHWVGLQWAVTADGVERRDGFYVIERLPLRLG